MNPLQVPILMYHEVGYSDSPWCIPPQQFEEQMTFLQKEGYTTISLSQLQEKINQNQPLPQKYVVLTFDDGRKGVHTHAFPLLQRYGFTATIYIVPSWVEGQNIPVDESYSAFLSWDELRELSHAGFEIGSHSFSHQNMAAVDAQELEKELSKAENVIEEQLHKKVYHFAYPYGLYNERALSAVRSRYATAVTIERGFSKAAAQFARQGILNNTSLEEFRKLLTPPTLSVAMIVKDEEKYLAQCLESLRGLANEIIIVDTGSTDKTKQIAAQYTDTIIDFEWIDDFAAARNEALKHATGDWVLIVDADEIIAPEDHDKIKEAMNNWTISGYQILTRNYTNATSMTNWQPCSFMDPYARSYAGWFPSLKVRLFQRQKSTQFEGRIHEMVEASITNNGGLLKVLPSLVHHYGEDAKDPVKVQRYLELSRKKVADNPTDAKAYFELGVLHKEARQYADAEKAFLESVSRDEIHIAPLLNLAIVQQKQKKYAAAIENYTKVLAKTNDVHPDAHFGLGFCYFQHNDLERALTHFQHAVIQNPHFVDAYINVGAVWERLGKFRQGIEALEDAISIAPHHARAHYNLGVIYEKGGDFAKAMASYENAIRLNYSRKAEIIPKVKKMKEILEESDGENKNQ